MSVIQQAILASSSSLLADQGLPLPGDNFPGTSTVGPAGSLGIPVTPTGYQIGDTVSGHVLGGVNSGFLRKKYLGNFVGDPSFFDVVTPVHTILDQNVSFDLVSLADNFTMEWCGYIKIGVTGFYNFCLRSDDQSAMWIGNAALSGSTYGPGGNHLIDNITSQQTNVPVYNDNSVYLDQDFYYPVRIRMQEMGGAELLRLYYGIADGVNVLLGNVSGIVFSHTNISYNGF
jgi:hypothetical protein